jgi:pyrimidine-nucleoside phosphorylase
MAIYFQGMDRRETVDLTLAMAHSGDQLDIHRAVNYALDKHSSGGVGDKTSLVVLPVVVACGYPVGKMSGRALGFSGGTLDKMESIPGWQAELSVDQFLDQLREHHIVLCGQTGDLAPADRQLYALRDVTATVSAPALIASSIMSKKLAAGADGIVLDVKMGRGAFVTTLEEARRLATLMAQVGADAGRQVVALISDMNQPLGRAVGNAIEVREAIATLHGEGPADFRDHCVEVGAQMVALADGTGDVEAARAECRARLDDGSAWEQFRVLVRVQGGDVMAVDEPARLPTAPLIREVRAPQGGYISAVDAEIVGRTAMALGAGRERKDDPIDHAVGCEVLVNVGDRVAAGEIILRIHANSEQQVAEARERLLGALGWSDEPVDPLPLFYDRITGA